jgi:hypothetical protein
MTHTRRLAATVALACAIAALSAACGSSSPGTGPSTGGTCTAGPTSTTITISNNAVCPQNITVPHFCKQSRFDSRRCAFPRVLFRHRAERRVE